MAVGISAIALAGLVAVDVPAATAATISTTAGPCKTDQAAILARVNKERSKRKIRAADLAMSAWMNSAGHKSNVLNPKFKKLGVGCTRRGTTGNGYYWSQNFGS